MTTTWTNLPYDSPPLRTAGTVRVRYAPADFVTLLWRELSLMIVVFLVVFLIGAGLAFTLKKSYTAQSSLFVRVGQEYVYQPRAGDAGRGAVPNIDQVVQSESEILNAGELKDRVIRRLGLGAIFPDLAKRYAAADPVDRPLILAKAREAMAKNLGVETAPDNAIIRLTYKNDSPDVAVRVLNTLLEEYLVYRRGLLIAPDDSVMQRQRNVFETKLSQADQAYQDFLATNDIGDYPAQKASMVALQSQIDGLRFAAEAQLQDRTARLASIQGQLAQTQPEIGLYRDASTIATDKLASLKLERESLLSRYRPDAQPIKDIEAQIAQLEAAVAAGRTEAPGARRTGLNPIYQTLQSTRNDLAAEVAALQQQTRAYAEQSQQVTQRLQKLAELEPQYIELSRDRDVLQTNVRDFTVRQQQDEAAREIAGQSSDNISVVQRAVASSQGKSLRKPIFVLAFLFAAFTALCVGLLRMFLRPGLQTSSQAGLTLDLPVLATAGVKDPY
jgi:uncharacterized protein involved in exopolysaccharide biosynthesis